MATSTRDVKKAHFVEAEGIWILPKGRMTFVALEKKWRAKDAKADDNGQYATTVIIPPQFDMSELRKAISTLSKEEFKDKKGNAIDILDDAKRGSIKTPFLDADEKTANVTTNDGDEVDLEGWIMIRANSYTRRPVVRDNKGEVVDPDDLSVEAYSGRWARLMVRPHAYKRDDGKGIKFYVEGVQLLGHDDKIGGGGGTNGEAFGAVDEDDGEDDGL